MVRDILASAGGGADDKLMVEDVFSTWLRTGTGADVTVNTGIDMTKGYMLWTKDRSGATDHAIYDSARGVTKDLVSNATSAQTTQTTGLKAVSTTGHMIGSLAKMNTSGATYVDWVMRKAPKFFDIVTYTGNGVAGRQIPHNLGCEVGMIIIKATSATSYWQIWHKSLPNDGSLSFTTDSIIGGSIFGVHTTTNFTINTAADLSTNTIGITYVAYLFAHDPSADGIIQCGSFSGNTTVTLGWEPQWMMIKRTDAAGDWIIIDNMRGCAVGGVDARLMPNLSSAESVANDYIDFTPTGFISKNLTGTYIYTVIRRPNKVPTSGSEVFKADVRNSSNSPSAIIPVGFVPDAVWLTGKDIVVTNIMSSRLSANALFTETTAAETATSSYLGWASNTNTWYQSYLGNTNCISYFFKRAKGFFDVVCYTGTGVARTVNHNLGVVPELMIVKSRVSTDNWTVYVGSLGGTKRLILNLNLSVLTTPGVWNNTDPTDTLFTLGTDSETNYTGYTYVAYLFATLAGISKVGSYTGNGTTQTINCGFTTGARFILIKRTDSTGDWYVWDTTRGIVAANDPHLSLNTTSAEVTTDDSIDPESSGFIVNQVAATNINVTSASYIFLAIA